MCTRTNEEEFQVGWCPKSDTKLVRFLINVWEYSLDLVVLQPGKERARLVVHKVPPLSLVPDKMKKSAPLPGRTGGGLKKK